MHSTQLLDCTAKFFRKTAKALLDEEKEINLQMGQQKRSEKTRHHGTLATPSTSRPPGARN
jgi:hypothetical protein